MQELHSASNFKPPPAAPEASLARASHLAKQSLLRRSQLGKVSQGLQRTSRQVSQMQQSTLGRTSALGRMSRDPAAAMQVRKNENWLWLCGKFLHVRAFLHLSVCLRKLAEADHAIEHSCNVTHAAT